MKTEKPQLLLVEDNPADANLVQEALYEAELDCLLSVMQDGAQAIAFLERLDADPAFERPDLFLLDLNLPKIRGEDVLKRLRLSPKCKLAKVLVISSSDAPADKKRVMELGATDYFRKPSSLDQFMKLGSIVRGLLEGPHAT